MKTTQYDINGMKETLSGNNTNQPSKLFEIYKKAKYLSIKHDSYFQVYEEIFDKYRGKEITFVEIGVLNGGSLQMWREFFGPKATIIGIDLNPIAKKWEKEGFKIVIGNQSDPLFWNNFFAEVGPVDVILDDGGHTNYQQIMTADKCISNIKDDGMLVVEDVHTSYFKEFGNPYRYSFISFAKRIVDSINSRFPQVKAVKNTYGKRVYSISFYESIVCLHINEKKCFVSSPTTNHGISINAKDFRHKGSIQRIFFKAQKVFHRIPLLNSVTNNFFSFLINISFKRESAKLKKFFR